MTSKKRILLGVAMTLVTVATAFPQYEGASRDDSYRSGDDQVNRSGYSYVRETVGAVTVLSQWNGRVTARRNMPISAGDEILVSEAGRAEIGLADGNLLYVGGGTRARFSSLYAQQGEDDSFSAIDLRDGSVILAAMGYDDEAIPRIDTEDVTVYLSSGSRVRVNADPRRGSVVVVRAGSVEVRTRSDSYTLDAGQYLMAQGDEPPEISRGVFSRDRFDLWAADRLEELYDDRTQSASVEYVDDDYASEVVALDDYGDWEYSSTYSTQVWVPRVSVGWRPYSYGSWYYTPIGLTWWSYDPWGWYPYHYGSWYFDAGFRGWCWVPSYAYSPAWVYWAYTPRYVGWCPTGYYSFYSPWFDSYHRYWGWSSPYRRGSSLYFSISGVFKTHDVDFGGWSFTGVDTFAKSYDRVSIVPGDRLLANLGSEVAISPRPIVVSARGDSLPAALTNYVREAPALIGRTKNRDASTLAPVLGRQKGLSASTLEVLKDRAVVTGRGKLLGPGAEEIASRGLVVDRSRSLEGLAGRSFEKGSRERGLASERDRKSVDAIRPGGKEISRDAPLAVRPDERQIWRGGGRGLEKGERPAPQGPEGTSEWRGRGRELGGPSREAPSPGKGRAREESFERRSEAKGSDRPAPAAPFTGEGWRGRGKTTREEPRSDRPAAPAPSGIERQKPSKSIAREEAWRGGRELSAPREGNGADWRRSDPPAKRVIEGSVPGRRWQSGEAAPRSKEQPGGSADWRQREYRGAPRLDRSPEQAPAPREGRFEGRRKAPRVDRAPEAAPAPREYRFEGRQRAPRMDRAPEAAPAPREYRPEYKAPRESRPEPREYRAPREYRSAPAPRMDRPQYSAPAPRMESRPAPAPRMDSAPKGHGKGRKG